MNRNQPRIWMLAALTATLISSCSSQSATMPTAADLDRRAAHFRTLAQPQYDQLERDRSSGALSQDQYVMEKTALDERVNKKAVDAAWAAHSLSESERRSQGIPTPDSPQQINPSQAVGGLFGGGFYQARNDPFANGQNAGPRGGSGFTPGSSIMGRTGRGF